MKKLMFIALAIGATACATNGDIETIQTQLDVIKPQVATAASDAASAKLWATEATTKSAAAEAAANKAVAELQRTNSLLDKLFKRASFK